MVRKYFLNSVGEAALSSHTTLSIISGLISLEHISIKLLELQKVFGS